MPPKINPPKRHHYVPQMILRHFAAEDSRLWFWRREFDAGDVRRAPPQNLFVENDLYAFLHPGGAKDVGLELFFAHLEGAGAKFIDKLAEIVRRDEVPELDAGAWDFWGRFFYFFLKRTPGAIAFFADRMNLDAMIEEAVKKVRAIRIEEGRDPDEPGLEAALRQNAIVTAQGAEPSADVLAAFAELGLVIYRIVDPAKSFIVSDVPGATARFRTHDAGWSRPTLFLPLTADIAVGQLHGGRKVEVVIVDRDQARRMNDASTARSTFIAGRSEALIKSLSLCVAYRGVEPLEDPDADQAEEAGAQ